MDGTAIRLRLRVSPGARHSAVVGRHGDSWKVRVAEAPERGRANEAVIDLLARTLGVLRTDVVLVSGAGTRDKTVGVQGISRDRAEQLLTTAATEGKAAA